MLVLLAICTLLIQIELCNLQTAKIDEDDNAAMNWVTTIHEVCPYVNSIYTFSLHLSDTFLAL